MDSIGSFLNLLFAAYGVPQVVTFDDGPPFNGHEFAQFADYLGFKHCRVTPLWPEANGEVERFMKTFGKELRTTSNWKQQMYHFLRNYRATPHCTTGVAPVRSRRNNLVFYNIPEKSEGHNCVAFIQGFIASHMGLETLGGYVEIERAHRTPTQLNKNRKSPRPIHVAFLKYIRRRFWRMLRLDLKIIRFTEV